MDFVKKIAAFILCMVALCCASAAIADETARFDARPNSQKYTAEVSGLYQFGEFMSEEEAQACMVALEDTEMVEYIHDALLRRKDEIFLDEFAEPLYPEQLEVYYQAILNNYPDMYFVSMMYQYYIYDDGTLASLVPVYTMPEDEIVQTQALIDEEVEKACAVVEEGMSDYDKILAVHDYFTENYSYDYQNLYNNDYMRKHNIAALFIDKTAVCQGYGLGFQYVMQKLGIECTTVQSPAMVHLWNLVQLENGNWYHVDMTWDDPTQDWYNSTPEMTDTEFEMLIGTEREYFMLSDSKIKGKENPHYDCTPDGMAEDASYSDQGINVSNMEIAWIDGKWYYVDAACNLHEYSAAQNADKIVAVIEDKWPYLTEITFSDVCEYNGKLYYNSASKIMVYDPATGANSVAVNTISGLSGMAAIYNLEIDNGKMICTVANDYSLEGATQQSIGMNTVTGSESGSVTTPTPPNSSGAVNVLVEGGNTVVSLTGISSGVVCAVKHDGERISGVKLQNASDTVTFSGFEADEVFVWDSVTGMKPLCGAVVIK